MVETDTLEREVHFCPHREWTKQLIKMQVVANRTGEKGGN